VSYGGGGAVADDMLTADMNRFVGIMLRSFKLQPIHDTYQQAQLDIFLSGPRYPANFWDLNVYFSPQNASSAKVNWPPLAGG
jgi:hypothetical protein